MNYFKKKLIILLLILFSFLVFGEEEKLLVGKKKLLIRFKKPNNWGDPKIYAYTKENGKITKYTKSWPGEIMKKDGESYVYILNEVKEANLIFNNGFRRIPGYMKPGIKVSESGIYDSDNNEWRIEGKRIEEDDLTIEFVSPDGWGEPNLYAYIKEKGRTIKHTGEWPGIKMMLKEGDVNIYTSTLIGIKESSVIFNSGLKQIPGYTKPGILRKNSGRYESGVWTSLNIIPYENSEFENKKLKSNVEIDKFVEELSEVKNELELENKNPIADAGKNLVILENKNLFLDGSASYDLDGEIKSYKWEQVSGTLVVLNNDQKAIANFITPKIIKDEVLVFNLTVLDNKQEIGTDEVLVTVKNIKEKIKNIKPVSKAGEDIIINEGIDVILDGSSSFDSDGVINTYSWKQISGIDVVFKKVDREKISFKVSELDKDEILVFELMVTDDKGESDTDKILIIIEKVIEPDIVTESAIIS